MSQNKPSQQPVHLTDLDAAAVDAALECLWEGQSLPQNSDRARKVGELFDLLSQCPVENPPADLAARTLARIDTYELSARRLQAEQDAPRPIPFRWSELAALAAIVLIAASVIWPVLEHTRSGAREAVCRSNLGDAGVAINQYALDHRGMLPRGQVLPGTPWFQVGQQFSDDHVVSNSANLFLLARNQYIDPARLACPGNPHAPQSLDAARLKDWPSFDAVSYSYQNQFAAQPLVVRDHPGMVVLTDKNPQFEVVQGKLIDRQLPDQTNSQAHGGAGQNILLLNGGVYWYDKPVLPNGDVIYRAQGVKQHTGSETPASADDVFTVP